MKLHLFNPGYENGILSGNIYYTPPKNVQRMRRELALLPMWYADPEDYVWVENDLPPEYDSICKEMNLSLPTCVNRKMWEDVTLFHLPHLEAAPWGISPQSISFFDTLNSIECRHLSVPSWNELYKELSGRQTAALCLDKIREKTPVKLPDTPFFVYSVEELEHFIRQHPSPFVLKMPYSSSGRGLLRIDGNRIPEKEKEWITGAFRKQATLSIEPRLDKKTDFALEYYIAQGEATYKGISLFETDGWKTYNGNRLEKQEKLEEKITSRIGVGLFHEIKEIVRQVIEEVFGDAYAGFLGVDMMLYTDKEETYHIHPCVEINMRYTMGMVAIRLFERFMNPDAFGLFRVVYDPCTYDNHLKMTKDHPAVWSGGKLCKGYLPLCPVLPHNSYRAYVLIE